MTALWGETPFVVTIKLSFLISTQWVFGIAIASGKDEDREPDWDWLLI